ncbi:MAG: chloride channel protein [Synergistaceae bacterium]
MKNDIVREQFFIVGSMTKWIILAVLTGLVVGSGTSLFLYILEKSIHFVNSLPKWRYLLIFPGLWLSYYLVYKLTKNEKVDVEESIHEQSGAVSLKAIPVRLLATVITIATGGSVGKEGPSAQIGAGLMYGISKVLRLNDYDMKRLVICGMSAGISAVFGTPITGAIFGIEVLYAGQLEYDVLLPSFVGGIVSGITATYWGASHLPIFTVSLPPLAPNMILLSVFSGFFFGIVALLHIECLDITKENFNRLKTPNWSKPLIGATLMIIFAMLWGHTYLGLGDETIVSALQGKEIPLFAFALKSIAMAITLSCGGNGGVLTPTLFIGATAGSFFATLFGLDGQIFSALGIVAVLSGATNTPMASTILAMEVFGAQIAPFAGIACAVSYFVTGHRSLYKGQLMLRPKLRTFIKKRMPNGEEKIVTRFEGVPLNRLIKFKLRETRKNITSRKQK